MIFAHRKASLLYQMSNLINSQSKITRAEGGIRTRTPGGHYPLKIACLPIPPLRHKTYIYLLVSDDTGSPAGKVSPSTPGTVGKTAAGDDMRRFSRSWETML